MVSIQNIRGNSHESNLLESFRKRDSVRKTLAPLVDQFRTDNYRSDIGFFVLAEPYVMTSSLTFELQD